MRSRMVLVMSLLLVLVLGVCGGGQSSSVGNPVAPTPTPAPPAPAPPTASSVVVSLDSQILVGRTAQATATATLTNGQTQAVTTGWQSDVQSVATVSDSGLVTGVSNGLANVYVVAFGAQGLKQVRVLPNFQGQWRGSYIVRSCTQSGYFTTVNACGRDFFVGSVAPTSMTISQNGASISGNFFLGQISFTPFTGPIDSAGSVSFSGARTGASSISIDASWQINSPQDGRITGRHTEVWRASSPPGELRISADILDWLNRIAGTSAPLEAAPVFILRTWKDAVSGTIEQ